MIKDYWTIFYLSLIGTIAFITLFVLGLVFMKKLFLVKKYRVILLVFCSCNLLFFSSLSAYNFVLCCKDYKYVLNDTYIEEKAKVVEFTSSRFDNDGSGKQVKSKPKFYLIEKDEYIVLNVKNVELEETYIIRYYPNTRICDVIEKISE